MPHIEASTCACGSARWHECVEDLKFFWCGKCGAWRRAFEGKWQIPLEQAHHVAQHTPSDEDEVPTKPDVLSRKPTLPGMPVARIVVDDDEEEAS